MCVSWEHWQRCVILLWPCSIEFKQKATGNQTDTRQLCPYRHFDLTLFVCVGTSRESSLPLHSSRTLKFCPITVSSKLPSSQVEQVCSRLLMMKLGKHLNSVPPVTRVRLDVSVFVLHTIVHSYYFFVHCATTYRCTTLYLRLNNGTYMRPANLSLLFISAIIMRNIIGPIPMVSLAGYQGTPFRKTWTTTVVSTKALARPTCSTPRGI